MIGLGIHTGRELLGILRGRGDGERWSEAGCDALLGYLDEQMDGSTDEILNLDELLEQWEEFDTPISAAYQLGHGIPYPQWEINEVGQAWIRWPDGMTYVFTEEEDTINFVNKVTGKEGQWLWNLLAQYYDEAEYNETLDEEAWDFLSASHYDCKALRTDCNSVMLYHFP
jgi:hypothetical protein